MASYVRTGNNIKLLFRYHYARFLNFENGGRYSFLQDCIMALASDPEIRKKTVEAIGLEKWKESLSACYKYHDEYTAIGDASQIIMKLADNKKYLDVERFINRKVLRKSQDLPAIHKELWDFFIVLVKDSDIEAVRIERSEILKPETKMMSYDSRRERFSIGEYRETQAKSGEQPG